MITCFILPFYTPYILDMHELIGIIAILKFL